MKVGTRKKKHKIEEPLWERKCWQGWNLVNAIALVFVENESLSFELKLMSIGTSLLCFEYMSALE